MGNVVVTKSCESGLKSTEAEVEQDTKRRDTCNETAGAKCSSKGSRYPSHGKRMDPFHALDVFDDPVPPGAYHKADPYCSIGRTQDW